MRSPIGALRNLAPSKATKLPGMPVRYASRAAGRFTQRTGAEAQLRTMETVGTVHAIVSRSAKAVAAVEWHLYRKAASGKKEDRVEVTSHAALDLLNRPNRFFRTREVFMEAGAQHKGLTGETWWVVARSPLSTLPLELWPVSPARMTPVPDPDTFIAGYMYTSPDGEQIALGLDDVIFIRTPHPSNPYRGISPIQPLMTDIDTNRYSAEWIRNYFVNGAEPGGIIEVPRALSDPEFDQLRDRWNESHKGVANAHRVAILEHGAWKDRSVSQRDMQFVELRDSERELIREGMGFPKPMLGTVDDTNRANMEAAETILARWIVLPDARAIRGALNSELLPMYGRLGEGLEFDFDSPVPDDVEAESAQLTARSNAAQSLVSAGYDRSAVTQAVGLPDMSFDADRELFSSIARGAPSLGPLMVTMLGYKLPDNWRDLMPNRGPEPAEPAAAPSNAWGDAVAGLLGGGAAETGHVPRPGVNAARRRALTAAAEGDGEDDDPVRAQFESALEGLLADWQDTEDAWVDALGDAVETAVDDDDAGALGALSVDTAAGAAVLEAALAGMARRAADRMVAEAAEQGVEVDAPELEVSNRVSVAEVRAAYGGELAAVAVATAALLGSELARSAAVEALRLFTPGAVGRQVADGVRSFLRGLKGRFKKDQLGGALHRAQNAGRIAVLEEAPTARYVASERGDRNSCQPCKDVDGTEFDDLDAVRAAYGTGGYMGCEGGIRCRGTVTALWE